MKNKQILCSINDALQYLIDRGEFEPELVDLTVTRYTTIDNIDAAYFLDTDTNQFYKLELLIVDKQTLPKNEIERLQNYLDDLKADLEDENI